MRRLLLNLLVTMAILFLATLIALMVDPGARSIDSHGHQQPMTWDLALLDTVALLVAGETAAIPLERIARPTRLLVTLVIISGAVLVAMLFALITDRLLTLRLDYVLGKRGVPRMENHIVLVGLGQVGWRIFENLQQFSVPVVCIEAKQQSHHIDLARRVGATVIVDDARHSHVLENANVAKARSIICATDNDLVNLEVALDARELNPQIRVILRMYEQSLARKVTQGFDIQNAFSSSALAAPAFACAAIDDMIVNSFFLDSVQVVTLRLEVQAGSPATRMKRFELTQAYPCALLKHKHGAGQVEIHPRHDHPITAGDVLLINCALDQIGSIKQAVGYVAR